MINLLNNLNILESDCSILGPAFTDILQEIFMIIKVATPCLVLVLCTVDMAKAVMAQDEKAIKEAQSHAIKRVIIGVAIFFTPTLINFILELTGKLSGTCGIG